jgi:hypothetical protein
MMGDIPAGWITNGELVGEYVRPPSKWDRQVECVAIYFYRTERAWVQDAVWSKAEESVRKDYLGRAWAVASMCNFPSHTDALNRLRPLCSCDLNPETTDGPSQECPIDGDGITFVDYVRRLERVGEAAAALVKRLDEECAQGEMDELIYDLADALSGDTP